LYYKDRDNNLLGELLQRYTMLLFGVCMKYLKNEEEAKDAVQQVNLKVLGELQKYEVDYFKSWLYMVAKNHCLMKLRDKGKHTAPIDDAFPIATDESTGIIDHIRNDQLHEYLQKALVSLETGQQVCVTLFYLEKKSYQEIAAQTGYNYMQVKSYIQNGKRNLKLLIGRMQKNG
jgi:RNA polymerase sigma factor (sigma-70 family)